jgi:hypothetical protein
MKKLIIALAALMVSVAAYGQGQFAFNNRVPPDINARFVLSTDPATGLGAGYTVQLFGGPAGGTLVALDPASTTFRTTSAATQGYVNPVTVTVPGVAPGASADIRLTVVGSDVQGGSQNFGVYTLSLGGGTITPPNLPLGTTALSVNIVPEPSTLALGILGLGALLAIRRRK